MVGPVLISGLGPVVSLVFPEAPGDHLCIYLGAWDLATLAHGSAHELCVEIHVAHEPDQCGGRRLVALLKGLGGAGWCLFALAHLRPSDCGSLRLFGPGGATKSG